MGRDCLRFFPSFLAVFLFHEWIRFFCSVVFFAVSTSYVSPSSGWRARRRKNTARAHRSVYAYIIIMWRSLFLYSMFAHRVSTVFIRLLFFSFIFTEFPLHNTKLRAAPALYCWSLAEDVNFSCCCCCCQTKWTWTRLCCNSFVCLLSRPNVWDFATD